MVIHAIIILQYTLYVLLVNFSLRQLQFQFVSMQLSFVLLYSDLKNNTHDRQNKVFGHILHYFYQNIVTVFRNHAEKDKKGPWASDNQAVALKKTKTGVKVDDEKLAADSKTSQNTKK